MIINLVGAPASGKSTFAARYVLEHPEYRYCSIDSYRIEYKKDGEEEAWLKLYEAVCSSKKVILETCGLSWRLRTLFNSEDIRRRPIITLAFNGSAEVLHERLNNRQRREVPYPYHYTEHETIDFVISNLDHSVAPIDYIIDVTNTTLEDVYEYFSRIITEKSFITFGSKRRRKEDYIKGTNR